MGKLYGLFWVMALVLATVAGTKSDEGCSRDLQDLIMECQKYVMNPANPKIEPSNACCSVIQKANVPCLCSKVTKEIEKIVCMEKVVYVADYCKKPLQPGSKCGSYTIPSLQQ
ncbi:hypothetical protein [Oryza sativa Japonica Group]|uniref:Endosperm transfer cell specific PR60 n=4 Tax=Oryza TaxID=4527 RepID=B2C4J9_ORYSJ|nr:endosperm transfer cell specific PR60 precursor [Oryza sativa Japonica Group]EAY76160.1 hypothetical protein OsI_04093 [Oryza sativa Indica Group]EEE55538.1 hypothetical protein OsJ_03772 [Oryza sativa Japonica Group]KAF2952829.1 hypothetical protein DAI22_01g365800 [Oryza sativa Japonica Group]BAD68134.1 hypothetical protein [Oryza sativa Japonica Group]